ncbi:sugar ABC transporter substrate-binding protein [Neobacillus kokaensis]|uniref:D-allose-binding periplasmic protein n=1 Tax=Neobacillus kokaensis TaxID=2759023 RepID=A0ABQ3N6V1_9BACI|nr:sugar ABC transporter substrate-binding protein [Neobacillus kokaensis]GHH99228.1 D-allose-binding periplasmic protein [Neobacillus kokaensis]
MSKKRSLMIVAAAVITIIMISFISISIGHGKPKMVVVLKSLDRQYWNIVKAGAEKAFKEHGIDGEVIATPSGTAKEQRKILKKVYKEHPDVLIIAPYDTSVIPILDQFTQEKNIPVILIDQYEKWPNKTSYVGADSREIGKKVGELLGSELQPGNKAALIGGDLSVLANQEIMDGAKQTLKEAGIIVVPEIAGITDDEKTVRKATLQLLKEHPDINGVIATNDLFAISVIKVLREHNLTIPVIGTDGIPDLLNLIKNEMISASVAQNPYDMGHLSVDTAVKVLKGEQVDPFVDSGVDIVIKENLQQRLDYHSLLVR